MSDPNIFAVLTAYDNLNLARDAFHLQDNAHCFHKAARGIADKATIDSREPTPAPEASAEAQYEAIILRFDKPPKDLKKGWQFGTSLRVSDVLLGHRGTPGISSCHFYITIDERGYVWLHDSSTHGTVVSHDGKLKKVILEHDKRLLAFEPGAQKQWEYVIVYVPEPKGLAFRIEFLNHRIAGREYQQNIQAFLKAREMALPCLDGLGLPFDSNPPTMPPSRQHRTLRKQPLQIDDGEIGRGQFGVVHKFIDMREGRVYAVKKFNTEASDRKRKLDQVDWFEAIRNEVEIMTKHPHPNIMQVIKFQEKPEPLLWMPYYPLGNLSERTDITQSQYVSAFRQILVGLRHLHVHGVAHRDVKPENLLIVSLHPFIIVISDFNLSKVVARNGLLKTFCGAVCYIAPEVVPVGNKRCSQGYRTSIDIWSTGVLMLELLYSWPNYASIEHLPRKSWIKEWCKLVVKHIGEWEDDPDLVLDIIKNMVKLEPRDRFTADQCLQIGCDKGLFRRLDNGEIVDAGAVGEDVATEVSAGAAAGAAILVDEASDEGGPKDCSATSTLQSPCGTESEASDVSEAPTILLGNLWDDGMGGENGTADGQLTPTGGCNSGDSTRRLKVSHASSWSLTIGLGRSDSDGGFDSNDGGYSRDDESTTGIFLRKDRFTSSLRSQAIKNEEFQEVAEEENSDIEQELQLLPKPGSEIVEPIALASFERRVLQLQA